MISSGVIGIIGLVVFFIFLASGVHIGIAMGVVGFLGMVAVMGISPALGALSSLPFHYSFEWIFVVLPMFLLLGHFSLHGGIGEDAYTAAQKWLGRVRGGLGIATTAACAAFGFASGSSLATAAMFTHLSLPEMRRQGYDDGLSCGLHCCIRNPGCLNPSQWNYGCLYCFCGGGIPGQTAHCRDTSRFYDSGPLYTCLVCKVEV